MAVVKADAYGHGDIEIALALQNIGAYHFAVSNVEEAIGLRKAGVKGMILILGYTPSTCFEELYKFDITQAVYSEECAQLIIDFKKPIKVQIVLDTGMRRIGFDANNTNYCIDLIKKYSKLMNLNGIFSHLCVADSTDETCRQFTRKQLDRFNKIVKSVSDLNLEYIHCLNSAGGMWHNDNSSNLVRLGIVLYGLKADYNRKLPDKITPALTWKSVVSLVKFIEPEEFVGYGLTFKATKKMKIATIPTGYGDGYNRMLSNKGKVLVNNKPARIIGRVCMDQFMIDVTDIPEVKFGDEVILIGDGYTADDMANDIGTIGYEVVCGITKRVPRIYKD